ncbi:MAG: hypothetical protein ACOX20_06400 [Limnochordia bacterium]|jgi:DNA-directed RNA polymerase subunit RPC12/RpoP
MINECPLCGAEVEKIAEGWLSCTNVECGWERLIKGKSTIADAEITRQIIEVYCDDLRQKREDMRARGGGSKSASKRARRRKKRLSNPFYL